MFLLLPHNSVEFIAILKYAIILFNLYKQNDGVLALKEYNSCGYRSIFLTNTQETLYLLLDYT